ncbi:MAG: CDP-glycerol glycerophosphotransferase family protein [Propionicimonas sp.]
MIALASLGHTVSGAATALAVLVAVWWQRRRRRGDPHLGPRAAALGSLAVMADDPWVAVAAVAVGTALMVESMLRSVAGPELVPRQLPGISSRAGVRAEDPVFDASCVVLGVMALTAAGLLPGAVSTIIAIVILGLASIWAAVELVRWRRGELPKAVQAALTEYAPRFMVYFSGTPLGAYQIRMWLPYLERTGERYALLIREEEFLETAVTLTNSPVVFVRSVEAMERVMVSTVGAVFYVNNEAKNANCVRFRGMRHVHLGHGDSDKPASYSPTTAMFDLIFVAGQAGADRFAAHGVLIPPEKFVKVGRPQLEQVHVRSEGDPSPERRTVLYAPTWRGGLADMGFGSLRIGAGIVQALLERGLRVVFRPHPYSSRDAESRVLISRIDTLLTADAHGGHLTSADASGLSIFECMNASDAMVTDVSSVASDYLYSRKPFAMTDMGVAEGDLAREYPVVRAAYILHHRADPGTVLAEMLGGDPLAGVRDEVRDYYLGEWPAQGYSDIFVEASRDAIEGPAPVL